MPFTFTVKTVRRGLSLWNGVEQFSSAASCGRPP
jgi:hypothetical protein